MMYVRIYVSVMIRNDMHTAGPAASEMHRLGVRPTMHAYS